MIIVISTRVEIHPYSLPRYIIFGWDVQYDWFGVSANYGYTKDAIMEFVELYDDTSDIIHIKPDNFNHKQVMSLSLVANPVVGFWYPMLELDYEQQFVNGEKYGYMGNQHKPQFYTQLNNWFAFKHEWSVNARYFVSTAYSSDFNEQGSSSALSLSVKKQFLKKCLNVELSANDIFHGMKDSEKLLYHVCLWNEPTSSILVLLS